MTAGVLGLVLIVGGAVAVFALTSSNGTDANVAFEQRVAGAFPPVLGANRQASDTLARLRGTRADGPRAANAGVAVRRVRQAATSATATIRALRVPAGFEQRRVPVCTQRAARLAGRPGRGEHGVGGTAR